MTTDSEPLIAKALRQPLSDPLEMTIRSLLGYWNAKRRGYWIVGEIDRDLTDAGLTTVPSFTEGWIDTTIKIIRINGPGDSSVRSDDAIPLESPLATLPTMLRVGTLASASNGITAINPDASMKLAQSMMHRYDYSQLAVLSGDRNIRGAVSWESIAQATFRDADCTLADAIIPAELVDLEQDLLALIPVLVDKGFVFVRTPDRKIGGIVTMSDVSLEFANLAGPFFSIGEIERRLRRIIDECFVQNDLEVFRAPGDEKRMITGAKDLSFGEYGRLLEEPGRWNKLGWPVDRHTFIAALTEIRLIRNRVMHFDPTELDEDQILTLASFIKWLRMLDPRP